MCTHRHRHRHTETNTHIHTHICTHTHTMCPHTCTHTHTHNVHACTHTHTHTHTHHCMVSFCLHCSAFVVLELLCNTHVHNWSRYLDFAQRIQGSMPPQSWLRFWYCHTYWHYSEWVIFRFWYCHTYWHYSEWVIWYWDLKCNNRRFSWRNVPNWLLWQTRGPE